VSQVFVAGGIGQGELLATIESDLRAAHPAVVGIAAAYVTVSGIEVIRPILAAAHVQTCRLVAGTNDEITHPEALRRAIAYGWEVRLGVASAGRFHPKLIVGGDRFNQQGVITVPSFLYVGSGNLTQPGLRTNAECAVICRDPGMIAGAEAAFAEFWKRGAPATAAALRDYAARFAERNRRRRPEVLEALGVSEERTVDEATPAKLTQTPPPRDPAVGQQFATTAWTGLQSFTGEFRFQIEFPRAAGDVVSRLVGAAPGGDVGVLCDDGVVRTMRYRFYHDNAMFRLNVQNDVPGVAWARGHRDGLAVVSPGPGGPAVLRLRILMPGPDAHDVMARSYALNTWGRTRTRLYGWF